MFSGMTDLDRALFDAVADTSGTGAERAARVRALVAEGADPAARDHDGATPLHRAVTAPYDPDDPLPSLDVARALLDLGADVNAVDAAGSTPLVSSVGWNDDAAPAAVAGSVEVIRLLASFGARFDVPTTLDTGGSLAHFTTTAPEVYAALLAHGVPADTQDLRGNTPLHSAVRSQRPRTVQLLLAHGVDTAAVNHLGQTALGIALRQESYAQWQRQSRAEIIGLLQAAGAPATIAYPVVAGGPLPIDMGAVRQAAAALPGEPAAVHKALQPDYDSYQELADSLIGGDADCFLPVLALCAAVLGPSTTRTLDGGQLDEPFFHHGDLAITGNLQVNTALLVTGSLTVDGCVTDCCHDSLVLVGGDLTASAVLTDGELYVAGTLTAGIVYGDSNDHSLIADTIRARLVIEDEHCVAATVHADDHFDLEAYEQGYGEGVQDRLRQLLVDEVFARDDDDDESRLDAQELFRFLRAGWPVFRAG
jgi:ankyrin repeat protein